MDFKTLNQEVNVDKLFINKRKEKGHPQNQLKFVYSWMRRSDLTKKNISKRKTFREACKYIKKEYPETKFQFDSICKKYFEIFPYNIKKDILGILHHNLKKEYFIWPIIAGLTLSQIGDLQKRIRQKPKIRLESILGAFERLKEILPEKAWPGIGYTLLACKNSKNVHPLYALSTFDTEAEFNENAVSKTLAVHWGQLMGPTAKELGMEDIYMKGFYEFQKQRKLKNRAERKAYSNFRKDRYEKAIEYKKTANELEKKCKELRNKYIQGLRESNDPRLNMNKNITASVKLLDELYIWLDNNKKDLTDFERDILVAAAYNSGKGAVKKYGFKVPPYLETSKHVWKVWWKYKEYKTKDPELYDYLKENYLNKAK